MAHIYIHPMLCWHNQIIHKSSDTSSCIHKCTRMWIIVFIIAPNRLSTATSLNSVALIYRVAPVKHTIAPWMSVCFCHKWYLKIIIILYREHINHNPCPLKHFRCYIWSVWHLVYKTSVVYLPQLHSWTMKMYHKLLFFCHSWLHSNLPDILRNKHNSHTFTARLHCLRIILLCLMNRNTKTIFTISIISHKCSIKYLCKMLISLFHKIFIINYLIDLLAILTNYKACLIIRSCNDGSYIIDISLLFKHIKLCCTPCYKYRTIIMRIICTDITTACWIVTCCNFKWL